MQSNNRPLLVTSMLVLAATGLGRIAWAGEGNTISHEGVSAHILSTPFTGDAEMLADSAGETLPPDQPSKLFAGFPVLESRTALVSLTPTRGLLTFWTRRDGQIRQRGTIALRSSVNEAGRFRLAAGEQGSWRLEVDSSPGQPPHVAILTSDGILELRQPPGAAVSVESPLRYVLVPSLIGTDLLFEPTALPQTRPSYLPSLNMLVGLQDGNDGMLVGVWPPGAQRASVRVEDRSSPRTFRYLTLDGAGQSLYLTFLDHPGIWHEEPLRDDYLETYSAIAWQRPFDARWIGRFFIDSDGYDFPFYFIGEKQKLWGRYIRGWFEYPVWFDGQRTMVHFEKKFPPRGKLLIYYLDTYGDDTDMLAPVTVMRKCLGPEAADRLLDFAGTSEQVLLEHRNAVCAMTAKIESYVAQEANAPPRAEVLAYADDVATFIRLIRQRVVQFDQFAADMQQLLASTSEKEPALADALDESDSIVAELRDMAKNELPETSLEEVRRWTDQIKLLTAADEKQNLAPVKELTQQCRNVAGTQDDLARSLSVVTIRLMEEAGRLGTASPQHVRVAEEMIGRCRQILRAPTWWEPCRKYLPKSNPGAR